MKAAGSSGQPAVARLAGAKRVLDGLAFRQFLVGLGAQVLSASDRARSANSSCHVRSSARAAYVANARTCSMIVRRQFALRA